jgi:hypothetical protein
MFLHITVLFSFVFAIALTHVLSEEESEDREAEESRHIQDARRGKETRKSGAVLQKEVTRKTRSHGLTQIFTDSEFPSVFYPCLSVAKENLE